MIETAQHNPKSPDLINDSASDELSANRTSLSFERTRMSADRTLMSVVRTSLSLISFGFTIHEAFRQFQEKIGGAASEEAARPYGLSLVLLGILMLALGIVGHAGFGRELTGRRKRLHDQQLLHTAVEYRATPTLLIALLLLLIGLAAAAFIIVRAVGAR